ncbi:AMIN-like domain-containing (lipo)protein [Ruania alba]|uniref:AMIN-like domain-containing protein n=1 Tax=Ruania alba TaxID=648782 RepID=A0A1H5HH23_9MICO|nr:hypothetical protein [Ruania alba]SEE27180.1 hypothetical protein SAMN04488554_1955 [Ruania alba]
MRRTRIRYVPAAALAAALALAGCDGDGGGGSPGDGGGATDPTTSESEPAAEPTAEPSEDPTSDQESSEPTETAPTSEDEPSEGAEPFPADTSTDTQAQEGEPDALLVDARTGAHEGFDRVVIEFDGTGTPGWTAEYVDEAVQDGSGNPILLEGDAVLEVRLDGTRYPEKTDDYFSPTTLDHEGEEVEQVDVGGTFEGYTQVVLGIDDSDAPFRVFSLTDPVRVVIDVQHVED